MKLLFSIVMYFCFAGVLLISTPAWSQKAEDELLKTEIRRFEAMTQNDFEALEQILGDDLIYTHSSAKVDNKRQYINDLKAGVVRYNTIKPDEVKVRMYSNGNMGIITGKAMVEITQNDKQTTINLRYTDVYAKRKGKWQMISWQATRMPE
jgi:ketosteroid isomerase-like protein